MPMSNIAAAVPGSIDTYSSSVGVRPADPRHADADTARGGDLRQFVELVGELGADAAEPERVRGDNEVTGELLVEGVADPVLE